MNRSHDKLKQENACHFATTKTFQRERIFLDETFCQILRDEIFFYAQLYNVQLYGFVIMPDHLHILFWPRGKKTASEFMRGIKSMSAKKILSQSQSQPSYGRGPQTPPRTDHSQCILTSQNSFQTPQKRLLWQSTYFDYITTSKNTIQQKLKYIKQNPVEDKLTLNSEDYKWLYINPIIN